MKIIFVRHGRTISNNEKTFSEETTPLCEAAYTELLETKEKLLNFKYQKIYASPLLRVIQTAEILGIKNPILDKRVAERDFGEFKGKTYKQILEENPLDTNDWFSDLKNGKPPGGESSVELFTRVSAFLDEISTTETDTLVICHHGPICMAMAWALKNFDTWLSFSPVNGGISEIETDGQNRIITKFNY
ncbi:MAG: histidine phosphatase family protein [Treponemataceae bacterium]